jgi:hypothetical protein
MLTRLIQIAITAALTAVAAEQGPQFLKAVQLAELKILKASESKNWGVPFLLPIHSSLHSYHPRHSARRMQNEAIGLKN